MDDLKQLERLEFGSPPKIAREIGRPAEQRWLKLSELCIDQNYQRHVLKTGKANIHKMIEEFSWALFGALAVGRRGLNRYAIIDGQHRALAALYMGIEEVPCLVLQGGAAMEAKAFAAINGNVTRIRRLQSFRAQVAAQDPVALLTVSVAHAGGVMIAPYPKMDQYLAPGETMALGSIETGLVRYGREPVVAALQLLRALDPGASLGSQVVIGTIYLLSQHPEWVSDAKERGAKFVGGMAKLLNAAQSRKLARGGALWRHVEAVLSEALKVEQRVVGRFMSEDIRRRAMAGR